MSEEAADALKNALIPAWMQELDPLVERKILTAVGAASLVGTTLALLDHCRPFMPRDEWKYVVDQLRKALD